MLSATYVQEKQKVVDEYLKRLLTERFPTSDAKAQKLSEAVAYSLLAGGKRIRPAITLAVVESYRAVDEEAVALASTTELLHTASLILDDLPSMDDAELRRGKPTNHRVFGESTAILASMALWSEAIRILTTIRNKAMNDIICETAESVGNRGLVRGQFIDLDSEHRPASVADLDECAYLKTGVLFKNAAGIGARFVGAPIAEQTILENFGKEFGVIYQMRDDLLDATETREAVGKDVGNDERNGRPTYVSLLGVDGTKKLIQTKATKVLHDLAKLPSHTKHLCALIQDLGMS